MAPTTASRGGGPTLDRFENRVYPAVWFLAAVAAQQLLPSGRPGSAQRALCLGLTGGAGGLGLWALQAFAERRTTVDPLNPDRASALVTHGPYRVSRNPMYTAMGLALAANAARRASWPALGPLVAYVATMARLQIVPEERALRAHFGDDYQAWARRTRRWL